MLTRTSGRKAYNAPQAPWEALRGFLVPLKEDYAVNEVLLSDASMSEVLARVAYRLIVRDYSYYPQEYEDPKSGMAGLARALSVAGFSALSLWVRSFCIQWSPLTPVSFCRRGYIMRARAGFTWRAVAYPAYKAHRADDPRVTNRGVIWSGGKRSWQ